MAQTGVDMQVAIKKQSALGTIASGASGQSLRRVSSTLNLKKDTYKATEIRTDYQNADFRHGMKKVEGSISGELSAGTYALPMGSVMRQVFVAHTPSTGMSITIAGAGPTYTVTRATGSWLTDLYKVGHVVRLSAGAFNAANLLKNMLIVTLTATIMTVIPVNGVAMVAEGPIATSTATVIGKLSRCPTSGHTNDFYTIEHYYPNMSPVNSESFWDCKFAGMNIALPPTGMATIEFPVMGLDLTVAAAQALTSPTAITTTSIQAAINGVLRSTSGALANVTGLTLNVTNNNTIAGPVVASNKGVDVVNGRHEVSGQLTAIFDSITQRDYFIGETEVMLLAVLAADSTGTASFIAFTIDRLKFGGADRDDSEGVKTVTLPFTALYNTSGGAAVATEATTLRIQDSDA